MNKSNDKIIIELYDSTKRVHKYELLDIVNYNDNILDNAVTLHSVE